jgi:hypothetical protein
MVDAAAVVEVEVVIDVILISLARFDE